MIQPDSTLTLLQKSAPLPDHACEEQANHALHTAILQTLAYGDIFDYPLTALEIHHYLIGIAATQEAVFNAVDELRCAAKLVQRQGYLMLPDRQALAAVRRQREANAAQCWPVACHYGRLIGTLPFVRMVAVTGSLAVNNVDARVDIDYLIVTARTRLWLCRALIILVVRLAAQRGVQLCPNYLISEQALRFGEQNFYVARELVQMQPLNGSAVYQQIRRTNHWTTYFLPNAHEAPLFPQILPTTKERKLPSRLLQRGGEALLRTPIGDWLEQWEMQRKLEKFQRQRLQAGLHRDESAFSVDCCKGHFEPHGARVRRLYHDRLDELGLIHPFPGAA